jgi:hypothetical protein
MKGHGVSPSFATLSQMVITFIQLFSETLGRMYVGTKQAHMFVVPYTCRLCGH